MLSRWKIAYPMVVTLLLAPGLVFRVASALASYEPPPDKVVVQGDLGREIDNYMTESQKQGFAGNLLVVKDGKVVICKGYGFADIENAIPYGPETIIEIGSITKQFTAAAILKLEMEGKLKVEDPISKFFPNVPKDKQAITLHHLLTHSSRLRDTFGGDYDLNATRDWIIEKALTSELLPGEPGSLHRYSNTGYSLLGAVVEIVSGMGYEQYLRKHLFEPAGMMHTGYKLPDWSKSVIARGYTKDGKDWGTPRDHLWLPDGPCWNLRCNGGIMTTLGDMYRWHIALDEGTVLSPEARRKFETGYIAEGPKAKSKYAYGWAVMTTSWGTKMVGHNGGNGIFFCDFRRFVDEKTFYVIDSNQANHKAEKYEGGLMRILFPVLRKPREETR